MYRLSGASALSDFRRARLLDKLRDAAPLVTDVEAHFRFYVDLATDDIDEESGKRLNALLDAAPADELAADGIVLYAIPRPGTRSPWSSKATDILHACGLDGVRRVERGVRYHITFDVPTDTLSGDELIALIQPLLHDRMIESILSDEDAAEELFAIGEPQVLEKSVWLKAGWTGWRKPMPGSDSRCRTMSSTIW